ncbi:MAG: hypothetical protein K9J84_08775, partial [Bacteroidia bacterium]|nr:hypothetical protein [Bacteroidia bacterium]
QSTDEHTNIDEENELITSVTLTLVDSATNDTFLYSWKQLGGPGTAITLDTLKLKANRTYFGSTQILDESKTPVFNVTEEIREDANHHRFVFTSSTSNVWVNILDFDTHVPPIELGLKYKIYTLNAVSGNQNLDVVLKHYTESSPKIDGLTAGSTDISVRFPMVLE